jgi:hypothetical protein
LEIMLQSKIVIKLLLLIFMLTSCIKRYEPVIESNDAVKFVVTGQVNLGDTIQHINISTTSSISNPKYIPVANCQVKVIDGKGNYYNANDVQNGNYELYIPVNELIPGSSFKVDVVTQEGVNLVSDFDLMHECPEVDTVYYIVKELPTNNPSEFIKGIQIYLDLNAENTSSRYFRWEAIETWEYHATWPVQWYYDGIIHHIWPPDSSEFVCWRTQLVKSIFTLSTENLTQNKYRLFPLHFIDNINTARLVYGYSLFIRQYAISEAAYAYWDKLRINSSEQGGLYETQPLAIKGNLHNMTNPDQEALGFFGVSAIKTKRIFISNVENLPIEYTPNCFPADPLRFGIAEIGPDEYPAYLFGDRHSYTSRVLPVECVKCTTMGGSTVKPTFWPK